MGLLPVETVLKNSKTRAQKKGVLNDVAGVFEGLSGLSYEGYEIHMGVTCKSMENSENLVAEKNEIGMEEKESIPAILQNGNVYGTYLHGIFDKKEIATAVIRALTDKKGLSDFEISFTDYREFKEQEYDRMAEILRNHLDMNAIYEMLKEAVL